MQMFRQLSKLLILFTCCLAATCLAQATSEPDFASTVIPITELKFGLGVEARFGTGFCLDPDCRFIATNYHVAMLGEPKKISGTKVLHRFLASGPTDEGATLNDGPAIRSMKYTLSRDLAVFELQHPLSGHHGIAYSLDNLTVGQAVEIVAFPKESVKQIRSLQRFSAQFTGETTSGLLTFDYQQSSSGKRIRPGASGGLVMDAKTKQMVGILSGIDADGRDIALAVPVRSLLEFVTNVEPFLAAAIFPSARQISPVASDVYPKLIPAVTSSFHFRPDESNAVALLRKKAQLLADSMRNFVALQTYAWGSGEKLPTSQAAYEIRVVEGKQRYRSFPDGENELHDIPLPSGGGISPGDVWSNLPQMIGSDLALKIQQAPDVVVNGRRIQVFQFSARAEDHVCTWAIAHSGSLGQNKDAPVDCYGEVWTDENTDIIRISEHYETPGDWKEYRDTVTYGWLNREGESPRLIPLTVSAHAQFKNHNYWCRSSFTNYRVFSAQVKLITN
jgi:hypothetical protein